MTDDISNTIEVLSARVRTKEDEANKLKKLVNELCTEAGLEARYPGITETGGASTQIRSDEFYGQTLTAAIRNYLERRKIAGFGAATLSEIYKAIKDGGYKFETANELNAKTAVGNALRKTSSIFHRLPNGQFGLLIWYPGAKEKPESETSSKGNGASISSGKKVKKSKAAETEEKCEPSPKTASERVTNSDIRDIALAQQAEFKTNDIEAAVKVKYPSKELPKTKIPSVLFSLKEKGLLKEVSPRKGSRPAIYAKA